MSKFYSEQWTKQNANQRMKAAAASGKTASAKLQEGFEFAYAVAQKDGNLQFVTTFLESVIDGGFRTGMARTYIKESIGNIRYGKLKDGVKGFSKANPDEPIQFNGLPDRNWWEPAEKAEPTPYNWDKCETTIKRAITRYAKEQGISEAEIADRLAHLSAEYQNGDIEIPLEKKSA